MDFSNPNEFLLKASRVCVLFHAFHKCKDRRDDHVREVARAATRAFEIRV